MGLNIKGEPLKYWDQIGAVLDKVCEPKGGWRVEEGGLGGQSIRYWDQSGRMVYEVDVLRCREPSDVIDWLYHLSEKLWMTEELMGGFVGCLVEIGAVCCEVESHGV